MKKDAMDFLVDMLRRQRHDFINEIQVVYGNLQIEKIDEAKKYMENLCEKNYILSQIYNLNDNYFSICMEKCIRGLWKEEIKIVLNLEIDNFIKPIFEKNYDKKMELVNNIFNEFENNKFKVVYIYIYENIDGINLIIYSNEEMIEELEWNEVWNKEGSNIEDLDVYKCSYLENLAYRLLFK